MKEQIEQQENIPQTVEEAVKVFIKEIFINESKADTAIEFLRKNPSETNEFCYQVFETYGEGDKTGLTLISKIIEKLL